MSSIYSIIRVNILAHDALCEKDAVNLGLAYRIFGVKRPTSDIIC